jgi:hypothetical protein
MLSPISQTASRADLLRYKVEPYVVSVTANLNSTFFEMQFQQCPPNR